MLSLLILYAEDLLHGNINETETGGVMITMKEVKDIVMKVIPGDGYRLFPQTEKAEVACRRGSSVFIGSLYLELAIEKMREHGLTFRFSR